MMRKCAGFSLLEMVVTVSIIAVMAAISVPSFKQWQSRQRRDTDIQNTISLLSDVRGRALAEKQCEGVPATSWMAQVDARGTSIFCSQVEIDDDEFDVDDLIPMDSFPWESMATISWGQTDIVTDWGTETVPKLQIFLFPGGTQSRIGNDYAAFWARIQIALGEEDPRTICFSRIAGYPFTSLTGTCDDN